MLFFVVIFGAVFLQYFLCKFSGRPLRAVFLRGFFVVFFGAAFLHSFFGNVSGRPLGAVFLCGFLWCLSGLFFCIFYVLFSGRPFRVVFL